MHSPSNTLLHRFFERFRILLSERVISAHDVTTTRLPFDMVVTIWTGKTAAGTVKIGWKRTLRDGMVPCLQGWLHLGGERP